MIGAIHISKSIAVVKGVPVLVTFTVAGGLARKSTVSGPALTADRPSGGRPL